MLHALKKNPGLLWGLAIKDGRASRGIDDTAMNVPAIPWANDHGGFWWAIGLCAVVVAGCWAALKRFGIL
jgi:hypothetical protein